RPPRDFRRVVSRQELARRERRQRPGTRQGTRPARSPGDRAGRSGGSLERGLPHRPPRLLRRGRPDLAPQRKRATVRGAVRSRLPHGWESPVPATALKHFTEDIGRARAILTHADPPPTGYPAERLLRSDLLRSAWMFAIGALDAYFCDAYTDIVAATVSSKSRQDTINLKNTITLPEFVYDIKFPIRAILEDYDKT